MDNKDIAIIALIVVIIYLYYQQNNQPSISDNTQKVKDLQQQVNHYQTLYQKRVEKDLGYSQSSQATQTEDDKLITQHQEQLRKINVLFDDKASDYQFIDFNGLYSLLKEISEREREQNN
jgi:hypothetical protein